METTSVQVPQPALSSAEKLVRSRCSRLNGNRRVRKTRACFGGEAGSGIADCRFDRIRPSCLRQRLRPAAQERPEERRWCCTERRRRSCKRRLHRHRWQRTASSSWQRERRRRSHCRTGRHSSGRSPVRKRSRRTERRSWVRTERRSCWLGSSCRGGRRSNVRDDDRSGRLPRQRRTQAPVPPGRTMQRISASCCDSLSLTRRSCP
jgi:hypothetical protein